MNQLETLAGRKRRLEEVMTRFQASGPTPGFDLHYKTPYQLLVSVVLSAKNSEAQVNRVMAPQYEEEFTAETVVSLGPEALLQRIRTIGLAPTKARNIYRLSCILIDRFGGKVPTNREDLESLPGVGRKTANLILSQLCDQPTLAVDTHVFRVTQRLGLHQERTPEKAEKELLQIMDGRYLDGRHRYFIAHGRKVCRALKPHCGSCELRDLCISFPREGR